MRYRVWVSGICDRVDVGNVVLGIYCRRQTGRTELRNTTPIIHAVCHMKALRTEGKRTYACEVYMKATPVAMDLAWGGVGWVS